MVIITFSHWQVFSACVSLFSFTEANISDCPRKQIAEVLDDRKNINYWYIGIWYFKLQYCFFLAVTLQWSLCFFSKSDIFIQNLAVNSIAFNPHYLTHKYSCWYLYERVCENLLWKQSPKQCDVIFSQSEIEESKQSYFISEL